MSIDGDQPVTGQPTDALVSPFSFARSKIVGHAMSRASQNQLGRRTPGETFSLA